MGEAKNKPLRLEFNRRLKLEFHGAKVTSDAGLFVYRELDMMLADEAAVFRLRRFWAVGGESLCEAAWDDFCKGGVHKGIERAPGSERRRKNP